MDCSRLAELVEEEPAGGACRAATIRALGPRLRATAAGRTDSQRRAPVGECVPTEAVLHGCIAVQGARGAGQAQINAGKKLGNGTCWFRWRSSPQRRLVQDGTVRRGRRGSWTAQQGQTAHEMLHGLSPEIRTRRSLPLNWHSIPAGRRLQQKKRLQPPLRYQRSVSASPCSNGTAGS